MLQNPTRMSPNQSESDSPSGPIPDRHSSPSGQNTLLHGDGSSWPGETSWLSFEDMWNKNQAIVGTNCMGNVAPNNPAETEQIRTAIGEYALKSNLPLQYILAVILQESKGCVRVETTIWSHPNPGLMQSDQGTGTCAGVSPCPASMILQMVHDGTMGTDLGWGLFQYVNEARRTCSGAQAFYKAARFYNSGPFSMPADADLSSHVNAATPQYASDVANRLTGWVG